LVRPKKTTVPFALSYLRSMHLKLEQAFCHTLGKSG
jgi:hypothetical protein